MKETQGHKSGAELLGSASRLLRVDEVFWICLLVAEENLPLFKKQGMIARADTLNSVGLIVLPEKNSASCA